MNAEKIRQFLTRSDLSARELSELAVAVTASSLSQATQEELQNALHERRARSGGAASSNAQGRAKLQDRTVAPLYYTDAVWGVLVSADLPQMEELEILSQHLCRMSLPHPTKGTEAVVATSISLQTPLENMQEQHALFAACKSQLRSQISSTVARVTEPCYLLHAVFGNAPEEVRAAVGPAATPPAGVSVADILARAKLIPKRSTHRSLRKSGSASLQAPAERPAGSTADVLQVVLQHLFPVAGGRPAWEMRSLVSGEHPGRAMLAIEDDLTRQQQALAATVAPRA